MVAKKVKMNVGNTTGSAMARPPVPTTLTRLLRENIANCIMSMGQVTLSHHADVVRTSTLFSRT